MTIIITVKIILNSSETNYFFCLLYLAVISTLLHYQMVKVLIHYYVYYLHKYLLTIVLAIVIYKNIFTMLISIIKIPQTLQFIAEHNQTAENLLIKLVFYNRLKLNNCFSNNHDNVLHVTMSHMLT